MNRWVLDAGSWVGAQGPRQGIDDAISGVVGSIGRPSFGTIALASLNKALRVDSWSIYRVHRRQPPRIYASGSFGVPDTTADCFRVYREGLYQVDSSFDLVHEAPPASSPVMTHWRADELGTEHRERIYLRYGMRERLSLIHADPDGGLMCVNLYRHFPQRGFSDADFDWAQASSPWLLACVTRHVELAAPAFPEPALPTPIARLRQRCPALTTREAETCERLLRGWTHDGIACDLGLSVATVKTYRNRAFNRLGINFRSQLFSLAIQGEREREDGFGSGPLSSSGMTDGAGLSASIRPHGPRETL